MAGLSKIEWTERVWNPVAGCLILSPGCTNCYAMKMAHRLGANPATPIYHGLTKVVNGKPVWTGEMRLVESALLAPIRWRRPAVIFVNSMSDLFADNIPDAWIDQVFAVMALSPQHTYQVLTKRAARMRAYLTAPGVEKRIISEAFKIDCEGGAWMSADLQIAGLNPLPLPNVWLGVSAEDQPRFDERVGHLRNTPAAIRFISFEPLLGLIKAKGGLMGFGLGEPANCVCGHGHGFDRCPNYGAVSPSCHRCACQEFRRAPGSGGIHWAIVGGENGPRPMHPDWPRQLRDDCAATGTEFFFKQWGTHAWVERIEGDATTLTAYRAGKKAAGRLLDGALHDARPEAR